MSSILENDGLVGLKNDGLVGLENDGLVGLEIDGLVGLENNGLVGLKNDGLIGLENDGLVGLENDGPIGLENDGLVGLQNDSLNRDGLAMVVNDNCEFIFEGRLYRSYTDYVQARRSRTAGIFANSGMLAARSAIAEERTDPGPRWAKNPRDDLAIPPLLPRRKSSRIARTVSEGIDLAEFVRSDASFRILRGLNP